MKAYMKLAELEMQVYVNTSHYARYTATSVK